MLERRERVGDRRRLPGPRDPPAGLAARLLERLAATLPERGEVTLAVATAQAPAPRRRPRPAIAPGVAVPAPARGAGEMSGGRVAGGAIRSWRSSASIDDPVDRRPQLPFGERCVAEGADGVRGLRVLALARLPALLLALDPRVAPLAHQLASL